MARTHGNRQKHENPNPVQAWLIRRFHREIVRLVRRVNPTSVLDVGCGEGYVLAALLEAGITAPLRGLDRSAEAVKQAQRRLGPGVDLRVADASNVVHDGPAADLVMMIEVLEHVPHPEQMLNVLHRLAARAVLLSVPWEPWFRLANLVRLKNVSRLGNDPEHINHWGRREFPRFVTSRFSVMEAHHSFPWSLVLAER